MGQIPYKRSWISEIGGAPRIDQNFNPYCKNVRDTGKVTLKKKIDHRVQTIGFCTEREASGVWIFTPNSYQEQNMILEK